MAVQVKFNLGKFLNGCNYIWKYRKYMFPLICDFGTFLPNFALLAEAYKEGMDGASKAKQAFTNLLDLESVKAFVVSTETDADDKAWNELAKHLNDEESFIDFWRIVVGEKDIIIRNRWSWLIGSAVGQVMDVKAQVEENKE